MELIQCVCNIVCHTLPGAQNIFQITQETVCPCTQVIDSHNGIIHIIFCPVYQIVRTFSGFIGHSGNVVQTERNVIHSGFRVVQHAIHNVLQSRKSIGKPFQIVLAEFQNQVRFHLPYNTACVYSFSKYFGATGWRLAVIATAQNNVFDDLIAKLPDDKKRALANRYACLTDHIEKVKFTDRMVADSRLVALNGTAGLGTPQQVMMSLFALYCLLDDADVYRTKMQQLVQHRLGLLWKSLGWTLEPDPERAGYYSVIDLGIWATRLYGADFFTWLKKNYDSLDIVVRLAQDTGVVLMDGHGFDAPEWSVRVSLANLNADDYIAIGQRLSAMLTDYAEVWKTEK